jgi:hypothetical protein
MKAVTVSFVILSSFQDNTPQSPVILKQVQDDEFEGGALHK